MARFSLKRSILLPILTILIVCLVVVFTPSFQKKLMVDQVGPLVDEFAIDYVHLTPWSVELGGLALTYRGAVLELQRGELRFCVSALVAKTISVNKVLFEKLRVDLSNFDPLPRQEAEKKPFSGLLATLDLGFKIKLGELAIDTEAILNPEQAIDVRLRGGGIKPKSVGVLNLALRLRQLKNEDNIGVSGNMYLKQLTKGNFHSVGADLVTRLDMDKLPVAEEMDIKLYVEEGFTPPGSRQDGEQAIKLVDQERLKIGVFQKDKVGKERSIIGVAGIYDGNNGKVLADYGLSANDRLLQPYAKDTTLPTLENVTSGRIDFDTMNLVGHVGLSNELTVSGLARLLANEALPAHVIAKTKTSMRLQDNELAIGEFTTDIVDDKDRKLVTSRMPAEVVVDLDDPEAPLQPGMALLEAQLHGIPFAWLDGFVPDYTISDGSLGGAFKLVANKAKGFTVSPTEKLRVKGLRIEQQAGLLADDIDLTLLPRVKVDAHGMSLDVDDGLLQAHRARLASVRMKAVLPNSQDGGQALSLDTQGKFYLNAIAALPGLGGETGYELPRGLTVGYLGKLGKTGETVSIEALNMNMAQVGHVEFLDIELMKPFSIHLKEKGPKIRNPPGDLAALTIKDFQLGWLSPFVPDLDIEGWLSSADFVLRSDGQETFILDPRTPLRLNGLSLTQAEEKMIKDLSITVRPKIRYSPERIQVDYPDLQVRSRARSLVDAKGSLTIDTGASKLQANGQMQADLQAISLQPAIATALGESIDGQVTVKADYRMQQSGRSIDLSRLALGLYQDTETPQVELKSVSGIRLSTNPRKDGGPAGHGRGTMEVKIDNWVPGPFEKFLAKKGVGLSQVSGHALVSSNGQALTVDMKEPFAVSGVYVKDRLDPFSVVMKSQAEIANDKIRGQVTELTVKFDDRKKRTAVSADLQLELDTEQDIRLEELTGKLSVDLPVVLDQPALLPGHSLKRAKLSSELGLDRLGKIKWITDITDIKGRKKLALQQVHVDGEGMVARDGGFSLRIPVEAKGVSGDSLVMIRADYSAREEKNALNLNIEGDHLYLNDVLNTLDRIKKRKRAKTKKRVAASDEAPASEQGLSELPDERAFWDHIPYDTRVDFKLDRLFYTDYLGFHGIQGHIDLTAERLGIDRFTAYFHDSPITLDGGMDFNRGQDQPYALKVVGGIKEFDLNQFFSELIPESKPRVEGLFGVAFDVFGDSPNLAQFRNHFFMDLSLRSRDGVFRPIPPDSLLLVGASNLLGVFGEGISFLPTSGFGAGVISRLVSYIKEIDYDRIDIHVARGESRDLLLDKMIVMSPNILFSASGEIEYKEGTDILQSPLTLSAAMDMRGRGASILYNMDLLQPERDQWGYWRGPEFKIWGTVRKPESNFTEIIQKAGKGTFQGGVTRPLSGIVGNVKYRWFDDPEFGEGKERTEDGPKE